MTQVIANAQLVLPHATMHGRISFDETIASLAETPPGTRGAPGEIDAGGDFLLPGLIDLHTDNLERQVQPRNKTRWPSRAALLMHDAHCAAAGITTVFDALCVGDLGFDEDRHRTYQEGAADLAALEHALKVRHFLHLRCELPAEDMLAKWQIAAHHPLLRMVSLMDHTPGFGQYADLDRYRVMRRHDGEPPEETERRIQALAAQRARMRDANRAALLAGLAQRPNTPSTAPGDAAPPCLLASHDDRTAEEVAQNAALGISIAEFPVTLDAARAARALGQQIIAGAPNIVRGGSHTGNVAVTDLVRAGLLDALASDYVPGAMADAAFILAREGILPLHQAVGLVSAGPAAMAGLADRGRLAPGLRADLVQLRLLDGLPQIVAVWCAGQRVA